MSFYFGARTEFSITVCVIFWGRYSHRRIRRRVAFHQEFMTFKWAARMFFNKCRTVRGCATDDEVLLVYILGGKHIKAKKIWYKMRSFPLDWIMEKTKIYKHHQNYRKMHILRNRCTVSLRISY